MDTSLPNVHKAATTSCVDLTSVVFLQLCDSSGNSASIDVFPILTAHLWLIAALSLANFIVGPKDSTLWIWRGFNAISGDGLEVLTVEVGIGFDHIIKLLVDGTSKLDLKIYPSVYILSCNN
jgi:hypothetical protein